jgi:hypothetical protein
MMVALRQLMLTLRRKPRKKKRKKLGVRKRRMKDRQDLKRKPNVLRKKRKLNLLRRK